MSPGLPATTVDQPGRQVVLLSVPADGAYLGVLRTAAAGLAARLHFTLDEIEDLRIAVDEACAMLIGAAASGAVLQCEFAVLSRADQPPEQRADRRQPGEELSVELAVAAGADSSLPTTSSLNWRMLAALTGAVQASMVGGSATITLTARRSVPS